MARKPLGPNPALNIVGEFAENIRAAQDLEEISTLLGEAARRLGFDHFALAHHADIARLPSGLVLLHDYPDHWADRFASHGLHRIDPVRLAAARLPFGFAWHDLPRLGELAPAQRRMLEDAQGVGLVQGYTIPLHNAGEWRASCSFVRSSVEIIAPHRLVAAECLAHLAWSAALRTTQPIPRQAHLRPMLSPRQRDCVVLAGQGKTDWEIGRILGIAENSVTYYLNDARLRFGVARRSQLILAALDAGEIELNEMRSWQYPL